MGISTKAAIFLRRLKSASFARLNQNIRTIHQETGVSRPFIFCDMLWCIFHYGVGYLDYHVFGFAKNRGANRKTFMTYNHNVALSRMVNNPSCFSLLNNKIEFLEHYGSFAGRDWLNLQSADVDNFAAFCEKHKVIFAKPCDDFGGHGVERIEYAEATDYAALRTRLLNEKKYLIEEAICQHEELNKLCPSSVNTLRIVTILGENGPQYVYGLIRVGSGKGHVDNISSGGMYTFIGEEGILHFPAFCDKTGLYYEAHPVTGTAFPGYHIPYYKEAVALCLKAALVEPRVGYVGWDVAITPTGPVLVEGNNLPGYDMPQNYKFHPDGKGLLPTFERLLGKPIRKV